MALLLPGDDRLLPSGPQARYRLTLHLPTTAPVPDVFALLLDGRGRMAQDADLVFFNQPAHPGGVVRLSAQPPGLLLDFTAFPADRQSLLVLAARDDGRPVTALTIVIGPPAGQEWLRIEPAAPLLAAPVVQLLRLTPTAHGIRCRADVQPLGDDLAAILGRFGAAVSDAPATAAAPAARGPTLSAAEPRLTLCRDDALPPQVVFRVDWAKPEPFPCRGLGCVFEWRDGRTGAVQGLGTLPGSLTDAPYLRWSSTADGEDVVIDGARLGLFQRLLFYVYRSGAPTALPPLLRQAGFRAEPHGPVPVQPEPTLPPGRVYLLGRIERAGRSYMLYRQAQVFPGLAELCRAYQLDVL